MPSAVMPVAPCKGRAIHILADTEGCAITAPKLPAFLSPTRLSQLGHDQIHYVWISALGDWYLVLIPAEWREGLFSYA